MQLPVRTNSHTKLDPQQKLEERESWHKLVVKIIVWNEGSADKNLPETVEMLDPSVKKRSSSPKKKAFSNKITQSEWNTYRQQMIKTNTTYNKERVLADLKSTFQKIKLNGGFEE